MLLTRFIPKSPEDEILKGMGVFRHIDGNLHSMFWLAIGKQMKSQK